MLHWETEVWVGLQLVLWTPWLPWTTLPGGNIFVISYCCLLSFFNQPSLKNRLLLQACEVQMLNFMKRVKLAKQKTGFLCRYGLRYQYGMFRQQIQDGYQHEQPDYWLNFGNPWEIERVHVTYPVKVHEFFKSGGPSNLFNQPSVPSFIYFNIIFDNGMWI